MRRIPHSLVVVIAYACTHTEEYYDKGDFEVELRRVMNVCHGCRRCFSLCQVFPDTFNAVDNSPSGEMDTVPTEALTVR